MSQILKAPLREPDVASQVWISWFNEVGEALFGQWGTYGNDSISLSGTFDSYEFRCDVQGSTVTILLKIFGLSGATNVIFNSNIPLSFSRQFLVMATDSIDPVFIEGQVLEIPDTTGNVIISGTLIKDG